MLPHFLNGIDQSILLRNQPVLLRKGVVVSFMLFSEEPDYSTDMKTLERTEPSLS